MSDVFGISRNFQVKYFISLQSYKIIGKKQHVSMVQKYHVLYTKTRDL